MKLAPETELVESLGVLKKHRECKLDHYKTPSWHPISVHTSAIMVRSLHRSGYLFNLSRASGNSLFWQCSGFVVQILGAIIAKVATSQRL